MDTTSHSHVPYPLVLVHALDEWKTKHDGKVPSTSAEKNEFKKLIHAMKKTSDEENFEEAEAQAWRTWTSCSVPSDIQDLFAIVNAQQRSSSPRNAAFFVLVTALERFTQLEEHKGFLPLSGTVPDMKADTEQ